MRVCEMVDNQKVRRIKLTQSVLLSLIEKKGVFSEG